MSEKESLENLLPQAHPMILLSGYEEPSSPSVVETWVDITADSPFFVTEKDGVPGCVALEYMAQSMALCVGFMRRSRGLPPKLGFVLGSRKLEILIAFFKNAERYRVRAECTYQDESFGSFNCSIVDSSGAPVATAQLTAFQPESDDIEDIMEELA